MFGLNSPTFLATETLAVTGICKSFFSALSVCPHGALSPYSTFFGTIITPKALRLRLLVTLLLFEFYKSVS